MEIQRERVLEHRDLHTDASGAVGKQMQRVHKLSPVGQRFAQRPRPCGVGHAAAVDKVGNLPQQIRDGGKLVADHAAQLADFFLGRKTGHKIGIALGNFFLERRRARTAAFERGRLRGVLLHAGEGEHVGGGFAVAVVPARGLKPAAGANGLLQ